MRRQERIAEAGKLPARLDNRMAAFIDSLYRVPAGGDIGAEQAAA